jgi:NAD-dependent deacetylase
MFGEVLPSRTLDAAVAAAADCDWFVAIGTSLNVHPAAGLCDVAVRAGAQLMIVNADPTPYDAMAHRVVRDRIGTALPLLVDALAPVD